MTKTCNVSSLSLELKSINFSLDICFKSFLQVFSKHCFMKTMLWFTIHVLTHYIVYFLECKPKFCGRVVRDDVVSEAEAMHLLGFVHFQEQNQFSTRFFSNGYRYQSKNSFLHNYAEKIYKFYISLNNVVSDKCQFSKSKIQMVLVHVFRQVYILFCNIIIIIVRINWRYLCVMLVHFV